jgi:hypothetical protein
VKGVDVITRLLTQTRTRSTTGARGRGTHERPRRRRLWGEGRGGECVPASRRGQGMEGRKESVETSPR